MRKNRKKNNVLLIFVILIGFVYFIVGEDRYITSNVVKIDKVETVTITYGQQQITFDFNDEMIDLVSYGGLILEVDNMFEGLFFSYGDELVETNLSVAYFKDGVKLGNAKVYYGNDHSRGYILYMNNVYWSPGVPIEALLDLVKEK